MKGKKSMDHSQSKILYKDFAAKATKHLKPNKYTATGDNFELGINSPQSTHTYNNLSKSIIKPNNDSSNK